MLVIKKNTTYNENMDVYSRRKRQVYDSIKTKYDCGIGKSTRTRG